MQLAVRTSLGKARLFASAFTKSYMYVKMAGGFVVMKRYELDRSESVQRTIKRQWSTWGSRCRFGTSI